jgi:hypothetical protein
LPESADGGCDSDAGNTGPVCQKDEIFCFDKVSSAACKEDQTGFEKTDCPEKYVCKSGECVPTEIDGGHEVDAGDAGSPDQGDLSVPTGGCSCSVLRI